MKESLANIQGSSDPDLDLVSGLFSVTGINTNVVDLIRVVLHQPMLM